MIGEWLGHYEVVALLGTGGMGKVYRARDPHLEREVAIKVLPDELAGDPERVARFEREAKLLASLNHANIASIFGFERSGGVPFIAMELVEGDTLEERLAAGRMDLREVLGIARQIAEALEIAHDHDIVHRDLKPANVKVRPDGAVKVLDFGLAKLQKAEAAGQPSLLDMTRSPTTAPETRSGVILGTAPYMSPEQVRGKGVDARSDLWAFGCVLYECLAGRGPFQRETIADTLSAILEHEPDWESLPSDVPERLASLIERCLRKDPRRRLHHAADARIEIEEALASLSGVAGMSGSPAISHGARSGASASSRIAWAVAAVATTAALVVVALSVGGVLRPGGDTAADLTPVRFSVPLPDGIAISPGEVQSYIAVSPDGRHLAISGNGTTQPVWLHSFADSASRPLAGSEGAHSPFWSPNSRFVGFFAQGQLKTVEVTTGVTQVICDASWEAGNSWSESGTILFAQPFEGGPVIHSVPAGGGAPTPVSRRDPELEIAHFWPEFLPDGRRFLYLAIERSEDSIPGRTLYAGSLDGEERREIPGVESRAQYVSSYLLYVNQGTLVARPFDADRLEFAGDPVPISDELRYFFMTGQAEFSASRATVRPVIAFHGRPWLSRLVKYDRDGRRLGEIGRPTAFDQIRISPDGDRIAVDILEPSNGGRDLWIYSLEGDRSPRRLTLHIADERAAVWSPDGNRVAYRSDINGPPDLYAVDADGSGDPEWLLGVPSVVTPADWSATPPRLLLEVSARATGGDLAVLRLDGSGESRPLLNTRYTEWGGRFSRSGEWIAFVSNESGHSEVYVAPVAEPGARQPVSTGGGIAPRWGLGDGELYYLGFDRWVTAVAVQTDPELVLGEPRRLFQLAGPTHEGVIDATPDGQMFVVNEIIEDTRLAPIHVIMNWAGR